MPRQRIAAALATAAILAAVFAPTAVARQDTTLDGGDAAALCESLFGGVFDPVSSEPLADCQWDKALMGAGDAAWAHATGKGVYVGVIDSGVDFTHPDIAPNLDVDLSCSFIFDHDPLALPQEVGNGDCSNKGAVQDINGHGSHVASTIAAPVNGIGIAGVAPEATIVALKACNVNGYCFADSVAAALRYAGDVGLDIVNLSLFADPYLFYCGNVAEERAIARELSSAARYAQQRGVLIVASAGNEALDLMHPPEIDDISPDWPPDAAVEREIGNNCRVIPAELPGALTVMATGPVGYPGYTLDIADYSSVGGDVAAPGGDYFRATGTAQDAILAAMTSTDESGLWDFYSSLPFPGLTVMDGGARYIELNGTSMSAPNASGVAALIKQAHPTWGQGALKAAVQATASPMDCPDDWAPLNSGDTRYRCYGASDGWTSFFGHGLVNAYAASMR